MREREECAYWLCALCLHPIGYYGDTWAGVMCHGHFFIFSRSRPLVLSVTLPGDSACMDGRC